jgi:hypothetical protein
MNNWITKPNDPLEKAFLISLQRSVRSQIAVPPRVVLVVSKIRESG